MLPNGGNIPIIILIITIAIMIIPIITAVMYIMQFIYIKNIKENTEILIKIIKDRENNKIN